MRERDNRGKRIMEYFCPYHQLFHNFVEDTHDENYVVGNYILRETEKCPHRFKESDLVRLSILKAGEELRKLDGVEEV